MHYIIFGFGKFGQLTFDRLSKLDKQNQSKFTIIDKEISTNIKKQILSQNNGGNISFIIGEIKALQNLLNNFNDTEQYYIIPTAPVHLMADLLLSELSAKGILAQEIKEPPQNFNQFVSEESLYVSYAPFDKKCPDNCPGLPGFCHFHKIDKPIEVHAFLKKVFDEATHLNFKSEQLAPGLGGISHKNFYENKNKLKILIQYSKKPFKLTISTACNCHGVVNQYIIGQ